MPLPATGSVDVKRIAPEQVASLGPYSLNRIDPVGLVPPLRTALSLIAAASGTPAEAVVTTVGAAKPTTTLSFAALQAFAVAALLTSPL